jgi:GNAT superfamily N-acetyltransferase
MKPVALHELVDRETYERLRPAYRERIIALKQRRRVAVGDRVSIVFENRETLRFQVLEMARIERIDDPAALQHELDVYNELVPGDGELSATLFVEIPDLSRIRAELDRLVGIHEHVLLEVGGTRVRASFDPRQREEDRISAVQYIRFRVDADAFARGPVRLRIDHPSYREAAELSSETRASLLADLRGECEDLLPPERRLVPTGVEIVRYDARYRDDCAALIDALPDWFGIPESNAAYVRDLSALPSWVALLDAELVGAVTLKEHLPESFEVHLLAVRPEHHRRGIGRALLERVESEARARGGRWLHVKTLAPSHPDPFYARTRAFYAAMGFRPLFETTAFWGPENPALVLVKLLAPGS